MIRVLSVLTSVLCLGAGLRGVPGGRHDFSMDPGWRFVLGDPAGAAQPGFDDRTWRRVDVPHDWSIEGVPARDAAGGGRVGYFPTGIGWYRKTFRMPAGWRGQRVALRFDGVYMNSDVWLNGVHLGHRPSGYVSFAYEVTADLRPGDNVVAVRVDNSAQPNSRWYTGSGIHRHVWLTLTDPAHIAQWGTTITTPAADSRVATVDVATRIENAGETARDLTLHLTAVDTAGRVVGESNSSVAVETGRDTVVDQRLRITTPALWSVETPSLYTLHSTVIERGQAIDTTATSFGIRTATFDADSGFMLNGHRVKLRGVNLHQNGGAVGAAVPESLWAARLGTLKRMGVNAIRTSHNPPAPEFLDLCDRMGFLVMAEAFDEWTAAKVPEGYHKYFADWSERDLTDFVARDRNHPSIVLWSAGNEIGEQSMPGGADVLRRLVAIVHQQDPTRPVTTGNDQIDADGHPATVAFLDAEDVVGYNYVDRWHERRELMAEPDRHDHPDWKMVGTESGSIFESFDDRPSLGADSSVVHANYTGGMIEAERVLKWVTLHDYFAGNFIWTGIDYLGESIWPFKGFASGALDITGRPKDGFFLYQSQWTDAPMLHLLPHWSWPGRDGQIIPVIAYTNCSTVELFLNGKSLGEKSLEFPAQGTSGGWNSYAEPRVNSTTNDLHLTWDVAYHPGVLRAVGKRRDGTVACHDELRTAGPPAALRLTAERDTVTTSRADIALIRFAVVDSAGTVVPNADNLVHFTATGGEILAIDNGDQQNHEPYRSDHRQAYNGRGLLIVRPQAPGTLHVTAAADGLHGAAIDLVAVPGHDPATIVGVR